MPARQCQKPPDTKLEGSKKNKKKVELYGLYFHIAGEDSTHSIDYLILGVSFSLYHNIWSNLSVRANTPLLPKHKKANTKLK